MIAQIVVAGLLHFLMRSDNGGQFLSASIELAQVDHIVADVESLATGWIFLTMFTERPAGPVAEVIEKARQENHSYGDPLQWASDRIVEYVDAAHAGTAAIYGKD